MNSTQIFRQLGLVSLLFCLSSCASLYERSEMYIPDQLAEVGEARLGVQFMPTDSKSAISISAMVVAAAESRSKGPYRLAVFTVAPVRSQSKMSVTRLRFETPDGKSWTLPSDQLQREEYFLPCREKGKTQATFLLPTLLNLDFEKHGEITVYAEVELTSAAGGLTRGQGRFVCARQKRSQVQTYFIPTEIFESIRLNDVPLEHQEVGANQRGWVLNRKKSSPETN